MRGNHDECRTQHPTKHNHNDIYKIMIIIINMIMIIIMIIIIIIIMILMIMVVIVIITNIIRHTLKIVIITHP